MNNFIGIDGGYFLTWYFWGTSILAVVMVLAFFLPEKESDEEIVKWRRW